MVNCCVKGCGSYSEKKNKKEISYFRFPKNVIIRNKWLEACKQGEINLKNARICSLHFADNAFDESFLMAKRLGYASMYNKHLKPDAVPTKCFLLAEAQVPTTNEDATETCLERTHSGAMLTKVKIEEVDVSTPQVSEFAAVTIKEEKYSIEMLAEMVAEKVDGSTQTSEPLVNVAILDSHSRLEDRVKKLKEENRCLLERNRILEKENKKLYDILNRNCTTGRAKIMKQNGKKRIRWSGNNICAASSLRRGSRKAYSRNALSGLSTRAKFWGFRKNAHNQSTKSTHLTKYASIRTTN